MNEEIKKTEASASIPEPLLHRLYDCTGSEDKGLKGFVLFYVNDEGVPSVIRKSDNSCVDMSLQKLMEIFMNQSIKNQKK